MIKIKEFISQKIDESFFYIRQQLVDLPERGKAFAQARL